MVCNPTFQQVSSRSEGAATTAGGLRIGVVEDKPFADQARVVVEHGSVQIEQALLVDENLRAFRPFEDFIAEPRFLLPGEGVAQPRAAAALDPDAQAAILDALLGHQGPDLLRRGLADFNHRSTQSAARSSPPSCRSPAASSCN